MLFPPLATVKTAGPLITPPEVDVRPDRIVI